MPGSLTKDEGSFTWPSVIQWFPRGWNFAALSWMALFWNDHVWPLCIQSDGNPRTEQDTPQCEAGQRRRGDRWVIGRTSPWLNAHRAAQWQPYASSHHEHPNKMRDGPAKPRDSKQGRPRSPHLGQKVLGQWTPCRICKGLHLQTQIQDHAQERVCKPYQAWCNEFSLLWAYLNSINSGHKTSTKRSWHFKSPKSNRALDASFLKTNNIMLSFFGEDWK